MTFTHALSTNNYGTAKFIVDASAANGTHTTIAAALTAASSGDTIFIRQGTYTENITLKAGVNLCAFGPTSAFYIPSSGGVIINGTCTMTTAGTVGIKGIVLQTNGATAALAVTGSAASIVILENCYLNCTGNTGITFSSSSSSSQIQFEYCSGDLTTTGIALFSHSSAGNLRFLHSSFGNSGNSTTNNTVSAGGFFPNYSSWGNGTTLSNAATMNGSYLDLTMAGNQTGLTTSNTSTATISHGTFTSGTSSAISIGAGTSVQLHYCLVSSSNASTIAGTGTLSFTKLNFNSGASLAAGLTLSNASMNSFISAAGVGTSGQVLTSNGSSSPPTFQTAGTGAWTLISTQTASTSASLSFTSGITSTYNSYALVLRKLIPATNGVSFDMTVSTDGGSTYLSSGYLSFSQTLGSSGTGTRASTTTISLEGTASNISNSTTYGFNGIIFMNNVTSGSNSAAVSSHCNYTNGTPIAYTALGSGFCPASSVINAIKFAFSSGNINSGTISLYGISQ